MLLCFRCLSEFSVYYRRARVNLLPLQVKLFITPGFQGKSRNPRVFNENNGKQL